MRNWVSERRALVGLVADTLSIDSAAERPFTTTPGRDKRRSFYSKRVDGSMPAFGARSETAVCVEAIPTPTAGMDRRRPAPTMARRNEDVRAPPPLTTAAMARLVRFDRLGRSQAVHDPAIHVGQHVRRQIVTARVLSQADREPGGMK